MDDVRNGVCPCGSDETRRDRGQSAVMVVMVVAAMGVVLASALVDVGTTAGQRVRAQTAADAAALAALDGGADAGARLAAANGGTLVSFRRGPEQHTVTVEVRVGDATATARATNAP